MDFGGPAAMGAAGVVLIWLNQVGGCAVGPLHEGRQKQSLLPAPFLDLSVAPMLPATQASEELMALDWQRELLCQGPALSEHRVGSAGLVGNPDICEFG